jgi:hypothetical protein
MASDQDEQAIEAPLEKEQPKGVPSNAVYARVGDKIKLAAHEGVQRGLTPQEIIREIAKEHEVRLNLGELRLLLAGRRISEQNN